jgi:hypothetical protein
LATVNLGKRVLRLTEVSLGDNIHFQMDSNSVVLNEIWLCGIVHDDNPHFMFVKYKKLHFSFDGSCYHIISDEASQNILISLPNNKNISLNSNKFIIVMYSDDGYVYKSQYIIGTSYSRSIMLYNKRCAIVKPKHMVLKKSIMSKYITLNVLKSKIIRGLSVFNCQELENIYSHMVNLRSRINKNDEKTVEIDSFLNLENY